MSRVLIFPGQPGVLGYICIEDGGNFAGQTFLLAVVSLFQVEERVNDSNRGRSRPFVCRGYPLERSLPRLS